MAKNLRLTNILISVVMLGGGYLITTNPRQSIVTMCYIIAAGLLLIAAVRVFYYFRLKSEHGVSAIGNMVFAIILAITSVVFILHPLSITQIFPMILGIIILINGIFLAVSGLAFRAALPKKGLLSLIIGLVSICMGCYIVFNPMTTQIALMKTVGIALFISGFSNLGNQLMIEIADLKKKKSEKSEVTDVEVETIPNNAEEAAAAQEPQAEAETETSESAVD